MLLTLRLQEVFSGDPKKTTYTFAPEDEALLAKVDQAVKDLDLTSKIESTQIIIQPNGVKIVEIKGQDLHPRTLASLRQELWNKGEDRIAITYIPTRNGPSFTDTNPVYARHMKWCKGH